ncbi:hypothetical protein PFISCL1PPCAC_13271, partial [Pristionchus fissidentatus]
WEYLAIILPVLSTVIGLTVVCVCCCVMRRKAREQQALIQHFAEKTTFIQKAIELETEITSERKIYRDTIKSGNNIEPSEWEVDRRFIDVHRERILGKGAFGMVCLGTLRADKLPLKSIESPIQVSQLRKNDEQVAVKMLHESADRSSELAFLDEIELMKNLGYHERLVNMLACVTESEPRMLVSELCSNGDLLRYMTARREYMMRLREGDVADYDLVITHKQQCMFAVQIAAGLVGV